MKGDARIIAHETQYSLQNRACKNTKTERFSFNEVEINSGENTYKTCSFLFIQKACVLQHRHKLPTKCHLPFFFIHCYGR